MLEEAQREFLWHRRGGKAAMAATCKEKQVVESGRVQGQPSTDSAPLVYKLNFGHRKGRTIESLFKSSDRWEREYIPYLFARRGKSSTWYMDGLELALKREGWWQRVEQEAKARRPSLQARDLQNYGEMQERLEGGEEIHKKIVLLRELQAQKTLQDQADDLQDSLQDSLVPGVLTSSGPAPKKPRREHRSTAKLENTHCSYCGELGHRLGQSGGCPKAKLDAEQQSLGVLPVPRASELVGVEKRLAEVVANLKYTWVEQRSAHYDSKDKRVRQKHSVSGHELARMSAFAMAEYGTLCGVLEDMYGCKCPAEKCNKPKRVLGRLEGRRDVFHITWLSACYRCRFCRGAWTIYHGNPMFGKRDLVEVAVYSW